MKVSVVGLWHLGSVTAACLAAAGHDVVGHDPDRSVVGKLSDGCPPLHEPGLEDLIRKGLAEGRLRFETDPAVAVSGAEVVWITFDTPVDDEDRADVDHVVRRVAGLFPHLRPGALVLISSQLPVGTTRRLETQFAEAFPGKRASFAYSPENLRLGKAIEVFTRPDRVVVGVRSEADRSRIADLLRPFTERIEWMRVESAEMTKHALNGFLATSVAFANEIAVLCEATGADAREVAWGLKTDSRIGPRAYLSPGAAFAGGTLARDIVFLEQTGKRFGQNVRLLSSVRESNEFHRQWIRRALSRLLGDDLGGKRVAVWGLTYKPGTDTLRRSASVELCEWMRGKGADVHAHDPAVRDLPPELKGWLQLHSTSVEALQQADALVVATEWPEYREVAAGQVVSGMRRAAAIDPGGFLEEKWGEDVRIAYYAVGRSRHAP